MLTEKHKYYVESFMGLPWVVFCTNKYLLFLDI